MMADDRCFSALALGPRYWECAASLAQNLAQIGERSKLVLATDNPLYFQELDNVIAIPHQHCFGYRPYNDKLFAIAAASERFPIVIQVDVDLEFFRPIEPFINWDWQLGIAAKSEPLIEHVSRYSPRDLEQVLGLCRKLNLDREKVRWIGEHMFVVNTDPSQRKRFLDCWRKLAHYWDINKLGLKDGSLLGLAAAFAGLEVHDWGWQQLDSCLSHRDIHREIVETRNEQWQRQWSYRLRIARSRLLALQDYRFFFQ